MSLADDIIRNFEHLKVERIHHDHIVQDIIDYVAPFYLDVLRMRPVGYRRTQQIFDSTATYGAFILSQFIQGAVCNSATRWFGLRHIDDKINEDQEVAALLKRWVTSMLLAFKRSNFYEGNGQSINSWVNFGTAPLLCEQVPQSRDGLSQLCFTSIPFGQYVMCPGADGKVDTFIRKVMLPAITAVKMFSSGNDQMSVNKGVSDDIEKSAQKEPYKKWEFLHAIQPRDQVGYSSKAQKALARNMAFSSCWVEIGKRRLVRESGYRLFPVAVARYDLISGETYGRGPSEMALPDARTINEADKKEMLMWDRQLDPPTMSKRNSIIDGVLSKRAGGNTVVTDINNSVREIFQSHGNWQVDDMMRKRKEQAILRVYHVNEILNLLAREKPEMTAFEVNARLSLLQQIQGPVFGRLEQDYLSTIVNCTLDNMAHSNMLEAPPQQMLEGGTDGVLSIGYEGPLAKAQRTQEITDIQQTIADVAGVQQFDGQVLQMVDFKKVVSKLCEARGTQDLLVSKEELQQKLAQMAQQQAQMQQMQIAAGAAQAAGQVAPFIKATREQGTSGQAAAA